MISCLLVTKNKEKYKYLKRAVKSFRDQTYIDKELVIICGNEEFYDVIESHVSDLIEQRKCQIHYIDEDGLGLKLGDMRNISVERAKGDYIVNWDDDDINHPHRLETQYRFMQENNYDASFLGDQLHFFYDTNEMYWVNWNDGIPGTLMCRKTCFNTVQHSSKSHHEDGDVKSMLMKEYNVGILKEYGYLYMYSYNPNCVFDRDHHITNIIGAKDLSYVNNLNLKIRAMNHIRYYNIREYTFSGRKIIWKV